MLRFADDINNNFLSHGTKSLQFIPSDSVQSHRIPKSKMSQNDSTPHRVQSEFGFVEINDVNNTAYELSSNDTDSQVSLGFDLLDSHKNFTALSKPQNGVQDLNETSLLRIVTLLLAISSVLLFFVYLIKFWWKMANVRSIYDSCCPLSHLPIPPGDLGFPIIGETFHWLVEGSRFNSIRRKKYGRIFKTNLIGSNMIRVTGQEYVKEILHGEHDKVTSIWPASVRQLLGEGGLLNSVGAIHRFKRKILCKAFTSTALNNYIPLLQASIARNVKALSACERPLVHGKMLRLTFDLATCALVGIDSTKAKSDQSVKTFYNLVNNIFSVPLKIPGFGFMKGLKAKEEILGLLQEHIENKKKEILADIQENKEEKSNVKSAFDFIIRELMLEDIKSQNNSKNNKHNSELNYNNIGNNKNPSSLVDDLTLKELALELVVSGYFTSASTLTSCILEIARHPQVLKKLEEEMLSHGLLKEEKDQGEDEVEVNLHLIHRLTYMEQVLKETLRLRPPVLGGYRKAKKTFQLGNYRIPKGWTVVYNIRDTHEYEYEEAKDFEPERFAIEQTLNEKNKLIPFGGGPRTCIGREYARLIIKLTLIELIRTYRGWNLEKNNPPKMKAIPILHPADGMPCTFFPRQKYRVLSK